MTGRERSWISSSWALLVAGKLNQATVPQKSDPCLCLGQHLRMSIQVLSFFSHASVSRR